jgi:hypothetical protein
MLHDAQNLEDAAMRAHEGAPRAAQRARLSRREEAVDRKRRLTPGHHRVIDALA